MTLSVEILLVYGTGIRGRATYSTGVIFKNSKSYSSANFDCGDQYGNSSSDSSSMRRLRSCAGY